MLFPSISCISGALLSFTDSEVAVVMRVDAASAFWLAKVDCEVGVSVCARVGARDVPRFNVMAFDCDFCVEEALGGVRGRLGCCFRRVVVSAGFHEVATYSTSGGALFERAVGVSLVAVSPHLGDEMGRIYVADGHWLPGAKDGVSINTFIMDLAPLGSLWEVACGTNVLQVYECMGRACGVGSRWRCRRL